MKDWKTTASGGALVVGALLYFVVAPLLDNDPNTAANWAAVAAAVTAGLGLTFANDAKKEQPAAPAPPPERAPGDLRP